MIVNEFNHVTIGSKSSVAIEGNNFVVEIKNINNSIDAKKILDEFKNSNKDCSSVVFAFFIIDKKTRKLNMQFDDSFEGDGIATNAIKEVFLEKRIFNSICMIARYDQWQLGRMTLGKAYLQVVNNGVKNTKLKKMSLKNIYRCKVDYLYESTFEKLINELGHIILSIEHDEDVAFTIAMEISKSKKPTDDIIKQMQKKVEIEFIEGDFV